MRKWPQEIIEAYFWSKVNIDSEKNCWIWTAAIDTYGYGQMTINQKNHVASQLAFFFAFGERAVAGMAICHICDNRKCCNPNHLFIATTAENNNDRATKGRNRDQCGEKHELHKVKTKDILKIRKLSKSGLPQRKIAAKFKLSQGHVSGIINKKYWSHV